MVKMKSTFHMLLLQGDSASSALKIYLEYVYNENQHSIESLLCIYVSKLNETIKSMFGKK